MIQQEASIHCIYITVKTVHPSCFSTWSKIASPTRLIQCLLAQRRTVFPGLYWGIKALKLGNLHSPPNIVSLASLPKGECPCWVDVRCEQLDRTGLALFLCRRTTTGSRYVNMDFDLVHAM